jgi:hypothetical protein
MRPTLVHPGAGLLYAAALCGCVSIQTPAVIVEQSARGRSELARVIAGALHTPEIALADDALTTSPMLLIERSPARDERGVLLNGRELSRPDVFRLFLVRGHCALTQPQSGRRWTLRDVQCRRVS